jgi:hypothetical protein
METNRHVAEDLDSRRLRRDDKSRQSIVFGSPQVGNGHHDEKARYMRM